MIEIHVGSEKGVYQLMVLSPFKGSDFIKQALLSDQNVNKDGYKTSVYDGTPPLVERTRVQMYDRCIKCDALEVAKKLKRLFGVEIVA